MDRDESATEFWLDWLHSNTTKKRKDILTPLVAQLYRYADSYGPYHTAETLNYYLEDFMEVMHNEKGSVEIALRKSKRERKNIQ